MLSAENARQLVIGFYAAARLLRPHSAAARYWITRAHTIKAQHPAADGLVMTSPEVDAVVEEQQHREAARHA